MRLAYFLSCFTLLSLTLASPSLEQRLARRQTDSGLSQDQQIALTDAENAAHQSCDVDLPAARSEAFQRYQALHPSEQGLTEESPEFLSWANANYAPYNLANAQCQQAKNKLSAVQFSISTANASPTPTQTDATGAGTEAAPTPTPTPTVNTQGGASSLNANTGTRSGGTPAPSNTNTGQPSNNNGALVSTGRNGYTALVALGVVGLCLVGL